MGGYPSKPSNVNNKYNGRNGKNGNNKYNGKGRHYSSNNYNSSDDGDDFNKYKLYPLPCKSQKRWQQIVTILSREMKNSTDLIKALYALAGDKQKQALSCKGLGALLNTIMSKDDQKRFFQITLPFIKERALLLPALFKTKEINLLYEGQNATIELTEEQISALLAMSFFGLHTWERGNFFPRFKITNLFGYLDVVYFEKLKCILHYFYILAIENKKMNNNNNSDDNDNNNNNKSARTIWIYRHIPSGPEYTKLQNQYLTQNVTPLCQFEFHISGSIEDCENSLQVDFANKYIGGGVLGSGCVQEEIRFLINTECLVSLLLCQCMKPNEAIAIVGTRQFSKYKGYGSSFQFNGNYNDQTPLKKYGNLYKRRNCIIAIDAEKFYHNQLYKQYEENKMKRELLKCYTGFSIPTSQTNLDESLENDNKLWIATGNWGCGVFGGDIELKCILQWMAASLAERKIKYFAFGDKGCKYIESFIQIIQKNCITVGGLWQYLMAYSKYRKNAYRHHPNDIDGVFKFIVNKINQNSPKQKYQLKGNQTLINKKQNDVDPGYKKKSNPITDLFKRKKVENEKNRSGMEQDTDNDNENENEYKNDDNNESNHNIQRSQSFDENMLDIEDEDEESDSTGLQSGGEQEDDNTNKNKNKKKVNTENQSFDNDDNDDNNAPDIMQNDANNDIQIDKVTIEGQDDEDDNDCEMRQ